MEKRQKSYEAKGDAVTLNHKPDAFEAFKKSRDAWVELQYVIMVRLLKGLFAERGEKVHLLKTCVRFPQETYSIRSQVVSMPIHHLWPSLKICRLQLCNCMASPKKRSAQGAPSDLV